jgi:hypothetical protein
VESQRAAITKIKAMNREGCMKEMKTGVACIPIVSNWARALHLLFE